MLLLATMGLAVYSGGAETPRPGDLHGEEHPPAIIHRVQFLCHTDRSATLSLGISGAVAEFQYVVRVEALSEGGEGRNFAQGGLPLQRWVIDWQTHGEGLESPVQFRMSPGEVATIVWHDPALQASSLYRFRICLFDALAGLSEEQALVAKREISVPLVGWQQVDRVDQNTRLSEVRSGRSTWRLDEARWITWLADSYEQLAEASFVANFIETRQLAAPTSSSASAMQCRNDSVWNIPVAVMNLASDQTRRESSSRLLSSIGFSNVDFPTLIPWTEIQEKEKMENFTATIFSRLRMREDGTGSTNRKKYVANALSQIQRIRAAAASRQAVIIMEDDLMAAAPVHAVREHICSTLSNVPTTADMVYMEFCYESCSYLWYDTTFPR